MEKFCTVCGGPLHPKELKNEGMIPYCDTCSEYRFPKYNVAVSMIVRCIETNRYLLIQQYGRPSHILVAGYVNIHEDLENAVRRELKEEMGMTAIQIQFNRSKFFEPSNTLMCNYTAWVRTEEAITNEEVDSYHWFTEEEAKAKIKEGSLASWFLNMYLLDQGYYDFIPCEHIVLRRAKPSDLESVYTNLWSDEELTTYLFWGKEESIEKAKARLDATILYQKRSHAYFIADKETDEVIGYCGMKVESPGIYTESGLAIARKYQGRGYAKEMLKALLHMAFYEFHAQEFAYYFIEGNEASKRLALSFGFTYDSKEIEVRPRDQKELMIHRYILKKENYHE